MGSDVWQVWWVESKVGIIKVEFVCESQWYSCQLAKEMREEETRMILLRSRDHWAVCDRGLSGLPLPKSRQNPAITPDNFGADLFKQMCEALTK